MNNLATRRRIDASAKDGSKHLPAAAARSTEDIIGWLLNGSISSFSSGLSPCPSFVSWRRVCGGTSAADPRRATEARIVDVNFMMTVRCGNEGGKQKLKGPEASRVLNDFRRIHFRFAKGGIYGTSLLSVSTVPIVRILAEWAECRLVSRSLKVAASR